MAAKNQKTVKEQIAEYIYEFQIYAELLAERKNFVATGAQMLETNGKYLDMGWKGHEWNWDPEWDGYLVEAVTKLDAGGIRVSQFLRSLKIKVTIEKGKSQAEMFAIIHAVIGDISNVKFSKNVAWIQLNKPR